LCKCKAGELSAEEIKGVMMVLQNPRQFKVPDWFLNRKKDYIGSRLSQIVSNQLDSKLRDGHERLKKIWYKLVPSIVTITAFLLCILGCASCY
jgi:hypothetical protein